MSSAGVRFRPRINPPPPAAHAYQLIGGVWPPCALRVAFGVTPGFPSLDQRIHYREQVRALERVLLGPEYESGASSELTSTPTQEECTVTDHAMLGIFRRRVILRAQELGNVSQGYREFGISRTPTTSGSSAGFNTAPAGSSPMPSGGRRCPIKSRRW